MSEFDLVEQMSFDRLLPHRSPFLFVDRIVEFEPNRRIVGIKLVSADEPHLSPSRGVPTAMPPTLLLETVAQVGALLVLAMPEHRGRTPFLIAMDRIRLRRAARVGERLQIEVTVEKLRATMGRLAGVVRVDGERIASGVVTFALA